MALDALRAGGKAALARALVRLETRADDPATVALLDAAWGAPRGHAVGLTGPPGVGKSTLTNALIAALRAGGARVAVIAVDPSSRRTRGALLGDRTRLTVDPEDDGVFVRSMAARDRLGGLASTTWPALVLMRAAFDVVIVETVGVGQSETEIADVADTVVFCAQPGAGDSLQYMKAGVVEIPHLAVVTKADMGAPARRAAADLKGALSLAAGGEAVDVPVLLCSAATGEGVPALARALTGRAVAPGRRDAQRRLWLERTVTERYGRESLPFLASMLNAPTAGVAPFATCVAALRRANDAMRVGFAPH